MYRQLASLEQDLYLVYQPIVHRLSKERHDMTEFEVLLRSRRDDRYPAEFMDFLLASEARNSQLMTWYSGQMQRVLRKHPTYRFSLNIHPQQLSLPSTWVFLESLVEWTKHIQIEVTEKPYLASCESVEADRPSLCQSLQAIKQLGFSLSFDDVGSGLNTLEVISKNIEAVSTLKFSIFNFRHIAPELLKHFIIAWHIYADHYQIRLIVEGVETERMADYLLANGIEWQQGYYWAKQVAL